MSVDASQDRERDRRRAQAAAFDRIAGDYDTAFPHKDGQRAAVDALLTRLPRAARVLDVGCGTGLPTASQLADAGHLVIGIDISPVMLDLARRNVPEATFAQRDITAINREFGQFDAVVAFFSLLMLGREEIVRSLGRLRDVLVPGGLLAVGMVEADLDDVEIPFLSQPLRVSGWPRDQLRQVLIDAGYRIEVEDVRVYEPVGVGAPPEVQLFVIARHGD